MSEVVTLDASRLDPEIQQALLLARLDALRLLSNDEREWFISLAKAKGLNLEEAVREALTEWYRLEVDLIDSTSPAALQFWAKDYELEGNYPFRGEVGVDSEDSWSSSSSPCTGPSWHG